MQCTLLQTSISLLLAFSLLSGLDMSSCPASAAPAALPAIGPVDTGLHVFTCGHSFHAAFVPHLIAEIAESAGIKGHVVAGVSYIGGSHASQHWDVPDEKNAAKTALKAGTVDVLTLSCMDRPDDGISNFAKLGLEHNPNLRVTVQELWLPEDHWPFWPFDPAQHHERYKSPLDFNNSTIDDLKKAHPPYFKVMEDYVTALNTSLDKQAVFIVPDAEATMALREKILAGTAPGLHTQAELFADAWGHPTGPLKLLSAYCHFAVIYRRSPVGLPIPPSSLKEGVKDEALNHLLQQLAWDAVSHHPLSGVPAPVTQ